MSSTLFISLTIIAILLSIAFIFSNFEKGDLKSYQNSSSYNFAQLSHGLTAYQKYGRAESPTIVVIHGATLPSEGYVGFCEGLSSNGFQVICYDQYGRGYSDRPVVEYNMSLYVEQLNELLKHLSINEVILYGSSMGAPIAISFANQNSHRVLAVGLQVPLVHSKSTLVKLMQVPILGKFILRVVGIPFAKKRAEEWVHEDPNQKEFIERYIEQLVLPGTEHSILSSIQNITNRDYMPSYFSFSKTAIPLHISYASDDDEIDPKTVEDVIKIIPRAESFTFSGGHGGGSKIVKDLINIFIEFLDSKLN
tara:strand:+ start:2192 stop:3115 length:924 start_codon:yes stop_codon:yes gene_type:complete